MTSPDGSATLTPDDQAKARPCPFAHLERELWKSTLAIIGTMIGMGIVTALAILLPVVMAGP